MHADRQTASPVRRRRTASALERVPWRHVHCRTAPGAAVFRRAVQTPDSPYMLRHKVKAGITGWAQVNGWRGTTSLEKRIEYDLYYIENWSVTLDLKIMWLTLVRGLFQKAAI